MILYVIDAARYLMEAICCYIIYNKWPDFRNQNFKKAFAFCTTYVTILFLYRYFVAYNPTNKLLSFFIIFAYFGIQNWLENKNSKNSIKIKDWSYILTFSIFISLITECSHFVGYIVNRSLWQLSGMYDITNTSLLLDRVYRFTILALHVCFMFLIYKIRFIKMKDIRNLSVHKHIPIIFGMCLSTFIYIKYNYQLIDNEFYRDILIGILLFILPTYIGFYWNLSKLARLKNIELNENVDGRLEYAAQVAAFSAMMNVVPDSGTYEKERRNFKRKLARLRIDHGYKGFVELVLCLIMVKYAEDDNLNCENIIEKVSRITKTPLMEILENIKNIIQKTWFLEETNVFEEHYHKHTAREEINPPTVEDFLIQMAGRAA